MTTMTASRSSRSESARAVIWWPVAALSARARGRVDCRVDQDKGLISIVENKLAASSQGEGGRERGGGGACTGHRLQYGRRRSGRRMRADGAGWDEMDPG